MLTFTSYYEGGGFPITREGRLKFGFRARTVSTNLEIRFCKKADCPYSLLTFKPTPCGRTCKLPTSIIIP